LARRERHVAAGDGVRHAPSAGRGRDRNIRIVPDRSVDMALRRLGKLVKLGLILIGLLTVGFVVFSYGWNGEPPTVELE
jgi:hypothetical protein